MSRNYKFHNPDGIYFVSFAVVEWLDVFTRRIYKDILVDSLKYCQENKDLILYSWCIMTNHVHLIAKAGGKNSLSDILRDLKKYSSRKILKAISENPKESRKQFLLERFREAGRRNGNNTKYQFWIQDNHPIELWSNDVIDQKFNYVRMNPVKAGFVEKPEEYLYCSTHEGSERDFGIRIDVL